MVELYAFQVQYLDLRTDNPFITGEILTFDQFQTLERTPLNHTKSPRDRYYTIGDGDSLPNLAYEAYGNSKLWWVIYDVNDLHDPFLLEVGSVLLIPDLETILANNQ